MYIQFTLKASQHNNKTPLFKFNPAEDIVAVASGSTVTIYGADGAKIDQFDTGALVLELSWSADGTQLMTLSNNSHIVVIWKPKQRIMTKLTIDIEDPLCIDQSKVSKLMACASSQGHLQIYDSYTSQKTVITSKHSKRIVSLCFTHRSDHIVTLSQDALIVSNSKGETIGYLKQKSLGGYFINRVTAVQIKGPEQVYDAVVVPVMFDPQFQKKCKTEFVSLSGLYYLVINVDQDYLKPIETEKVRKADETLRDLSQYLISYVHGSAMLQAPQENQNVVDMKYIPGSQKAFNPHLAVLYQNGMLNLISLDHSRQEIGICTAESKFKYFTVVSKRETKFQMELGSYISLQSEFNQIYQTQDMSQAVEYQGVMLQSLSPCTSVTLLSEVNDSNALLVQNDKSVDIYDCQEQENQEQLYIDFTGGKNSLGLLSNPLTNIMQSSSGSLCFVAASNGASMMILTKNVSQSVVSTIDDVMYLSDLNNKEEAKKLVGQWVLNLTSPKTMSVSKIVPCKYSQAYVQQFEQEITLQIEPQKIACSQYGFAIQNGSMVQWSRFQVDSSEKFVLSWSSAQQVNIQQIELLNYNQQNMVCMRTNDGLLYLSAGGGLQIQVSIQGRTQFMKCQNNFIYSLNEKALLQVFAVELNEDELKATLIASQQLSSDFCGSSSIPMDSPGANKLKVFPNGCAVIIYKFQQKATTQIYLPAEEQLIDNIFGENLPICKIIFDNSLVGMFLAFIGIHDAKDVFSTEVMIASLNFSIADKQGPGVLFKKVQMVKRDSSQLPIIISNGVSYQINKQLSEMQPFPGIANIHSSFIQLKPQEEVTLGQNVDQFIQQHNYILPIQQSVVQVITADSNSVQVKITNKYPNYKRIPLPSQLQQFQKCCVELLNLGFCQLAFQFAIRSNNTNLIKAVADASLRVTDFETARLAYSELAMRKIELPTFNYDDYFYFVTKDKPCDYLADLQVNDYIKYLTITNLTHNNDPAAICMFINKICINERDLNTCMAFSLLIACPDFEKFKEKAEIQLDKAEQLLLKSNKPGLALSFRVDSLDWNTASVLAKKISSPYVRAEILIQQAGELECKNQFQEAIDICLSLLKTVGQEQIKLSEMFNLPYQIQPLFIGILSRCYAQIGKIQEAKDLAMPPKQNNKYVPRPKDPMNVLQRARINYECAEFMFQQKRYPDAAVFYEAAAHLSQFTFGRLNKELTGISTGEISLYDIVYGDMAKKMLLFTLLPSLKYKAQVNYTSVNKDEDKIDIALLRQIDKTLANNTQKAISQLPNKISDIVNPADIAELDPPTLLAKSANCFIKGRQYDLAEQLIDYVTDKNTIADLARVYLKSNPEKALVLFKKAQKSTEIVECLLAMKKVQDAEQTVKEVRLQLDKIVSKKQAGNEQQILDLETEVRQSANLIATYFKKASAPKKAIFYFIIGEQYNEAFDLAIATKNEEILIKFVTNKAPADFLKKAAKHFAAPDAEKDSKKPKNLQAAAKFLELSGSTDNAIKLLLNFGDNNADIDTAIDLLKDCRPEDKKQMTDYVLKHIQGGNDGSKKNPIFIFKLYLGLDRFFEASKTAFVLAEREIEQQKYQKARQLLLTCLTKLKTANQGKAPQKFRQSLVQLHAIVAGREFSQMDLHNQAGMCLYRASKTASSYGDQAVNIILSACVECWRAGDSMKKQSYESAVVLLKDYEDMIPDKYKKNIDNVVRKFKKNQEVQFEYIKCCQCEADVLKGQLECDTCQAILPLDTATGAQMPLSDYCECPYCNWTCSRVGLLQIYTVDMVKDLKTKCMMCSQVIDLNQVLLVDQSNYQLITGQMNWETYEHRPLIVFEDSILARKRYEEWVKIWYSNDQE